MDQSDVALAAGDILAPLKNHGFQPGLNEPQRSEKPCGACTDDENGLFAGDVIVAEAGRLENGAGFIDGHLYL